jgi:DNA-directed RNA polymerase subunit RPC12/RpoP
VERTICPHCGSGAIVKTIETFTLRLYFCLNCGKSFERKPEKSDIGQAKAAKYAAMRVRTRWSPTRS